MFDVTHQTTIDAPAVPDSATMEPPVRVDVGGKVCWLRPSNVLRIEVRTAFAGWSDRVVVVLNDSKELVYSDARVDTADAIAALLWPAKNTQ